MTAFNKAIAACDRRHRSLYEWQDCVQGVNIAKRLMKRVSRKSALKAGLQICRTLERFPGPKVRCSEGVRIMVRTSR
jgi:hypothetical protein